MTANRTQVKILIVRLWKSTVAEDPSSFKEREEILNHEVAGQVQDGTGNHEREC
jgi:hypothetical protein